MTRVVVENPEDAEECILPDLLGYQSPDLPVSTVSSVLFKGTKLTLHR